MSATASSALAHSLEPPRFSSGSSADLQFLETEKLRMPWMFNARVGGTAVSGRGPLLSAIGKFLKHVCVDVARAGTAPPDIVAVDEDRLNARVTLAIGAAKFI